MIVYLQMISEPADKSKFESLYMKYRGMMYHVAYQILRNEADAEDAVHQAFLSILKNMDKIRQVDSPDTRAYVTIITERKAIDTIRDRKRVSLVEYEETMYGIAFEPPGDHGIGDAKLSVTIGTTPYCCASISVMPKPSNAEVIIKIELSI